MSVTLHARITVFGAGYVGLTVAACLAELGHEVLCIDSDSHRIAGLSQGRLPMFEPGLEPLVAAGLRGGRLRFTHDPREACRHGDVFFLVVNTPADAAGAVELRHVMDVARTLGQHLERPAVVVCKSTAPVGTAHEVESTIAHALAQRGASIQVREGLAVVVNPEFLREGSAVHDFRRPDRVVIGAHDARAIAFMKQLYEPMLRDPARLLVMDCRSAELTKYAANAMLATRISFMNELARVAESEGADVEWVRRGIGADHRIGPDFIEAGAGYGGSCLDKDVRALQHISRQGGYAPRILEAVEAVNEAQKSRLFDLITQHLGADLRGKTIALWGLAFKPETDDMRGAPSLVLMQRLWAAGARVQAHDPAAMGQAAALLGERVDLRYADTAEAALDGADALVIVTGWSAFRSADLARVAALLKSPVVFDGRNLFDPEVAEAAGLAYYGIGRGRSVLRRAAQGVNSSPT